MAVLPCPGCGGTDVILSSSPLRKFLRMLLGSRKRFCRSCKKRWVFETGDEQPWIDSVL